MSEDLNIESITHALQNADPSRLPPQELAATVQHAARLADPRLSTALEALLGRVDGALKLQVILALATCGTALSIPPLEAVADDRLLELQAQLAVEAIRARLPKIAAGSLAVTEPVGGSLALTVGSEDGALSEPEGEHGRLSTAAPDDDS